MKLKLKTLVQDEHEQYLVYKKLADFHFNKYWTLQRQYWFKYCKENIVKTSFITLVILGAILFPLYYYLTNPNVEYKFSTKEIVYVPDSTKTMDKFLETLGQLESNNDYKAVNQFGYLGRWQLGQSALKQIGLGSVSKEQFLNNPKLQDAAILMLLKENKRVLHSYIEKYNSTVIQGVLVTESSILAACQLSPQGTIKFLTSKGDSVFRDGNNVPITKYLEKFSGYQIKF